MSAFADACELSPLHLNAHGGLIANFDWTTETSISTWCTNGIPAGGCSDLSPINLGQSGNDGTVVVFFFSPPSLSLYISIQNSVARSILGVD